MRKPWILTAAAVIGCIGIVNALAEDVYSEYQSQNFLDDTEVQEFYDIDDEYVGQENAVLVDKKEQMKLAGQSRANLIEAMKQTLAKLQVPMPGNLGSHIKDI